MINNENFSDVEFDWEEQHEKFAEVFDANGDRTHDSGFNTGEKSYRTQEVRPSL